MGKQLSVSFTVTWSGAPAGSTYYILAGVADSSTNDWVQGTKASSSPDICTANTGHHWADCYIQSPNTDGSFTVVFSVDTPPTGTYSYYVAADILYYSTSCSSNNDLCVETYNDSNNFDITIVDTFNLTVDVPSEVPITLDGVPQSTGSVGVDLHPGTHAISVPAIVQLDSTSRLMFKGWSDGSTQLTRTFDLESDTTITATYVTQYLVNATSDSTLQSGWYDQGTVLPLNVSNQLVNNYRLLTGGFDGWYNRVQLISKSPSASVTVDGPVNLSDKWNYLPYVPPVIIVVLVAVILFFARRGTIPTPKLPEWKLSRAKRSRKRVRRSKPKAEALAPEAESEVAKADEVKEAKPPKPAMTIMYCNQCGVVMSRDSKFCKECGSKQT